MPRKTGRNAKEWSRSVRLVQLNHKSEIRRIESTGGCFEPRLVLSGHGSLEQTLCREPIAAAENDLIFNIGMRNLADQKYRVPTSAVHARLLSHTCP